MKCQKVRTYLAKNIGEDLTSSIPKEIASHLDNCQHCTEYFEFVRKSFMALATTNITLPQSPYFFPNLLQKMTLRIQQEKSSVIQKYYRPIATSLVVITAVFLGFFIGNTNSILYNSPESFVDVSDDEYISFVQADIFEEEYIKILTDE
ncbi:MAG: hypothetical protein HOA61_11635 [Bacteroidetes bacterium]|jgi:hypothetical protein|nr:hypothetical protein [Bacteroidota bacterium]MBT6836685.1 hypothetical protein [Bacteroidota bacterium]MBT7827570.1 hypothetical protein [Bacteroidota bacterium]MBT7994797.1 hypothetical protein [Bacteroidota bacterium]